jgi:hypothetical protein
VSAFIETIDIRTIIDQLVGQQFFLTPNVIVDRTHRIKIEIKGARLVYQLFTDFLYEKSNHLYGTEPGPYIAILSEAGEKLRLENTDLKRRFQGKAGSFLREGLATENILFISTIATILEVLDVKHYQELIARLRSAFKQLVYENSIELEKENYLTVFDGGIKRLGEIADPNFSILLNLIKLVDLAQIFQIEDRIHGVPDYYNKHLKIVLQKIKSGKN